MAYRCLGCTNNTFFVGLFVYLNGKIPDWVLYICYLIGCHAVHRIRCPDTDIVMTGRAVIMPQRYNKDIQHVSNIDNPHTLGTIAEVNRNIHVTSVSDFNAYVSWVTRFYGRNVLDKSKTIDGRDN